MILDTWYIIFIILQIFHSQEEIFTGFYKKSPIFSMPKKIFIIFEILFLLFNTAFIFFTQLPFREYWMAIFLLLMFGNGIEHFLWALEKKKYVPGLITGIIILVTFIVFYFSVML